MYNVGDTVEILEPDDKDNYPYGWIGEMGEYVGTKTQIVRIYSYGTTTDNPIYQLYDNEYSWHESNLKLVSKTKFKSPIELGETVIVTQGEHKDKVSTVVECYDRNGRVFYHVQNVSYYMRGDELKPLKDVQNLF